MTLSHDTPSTRAEEPFTITTLNEDTDATILRLHAMRTSSAIDATLTKLSANLDDQVESGNLTINPKYAMIDLVDSDTPVGSTIPENDALPDISHPLQVSDYDVYGEQVNC